MPERRTVLGGWGLEPHVLQPLFGDAPEYLDVNRLLPGLIDAGRLKDGWREACAAAIAPQLARPRLLAGWSTGAIVALGCAPLLRPEALVLISPTASFCRTPQFRHGMRPAALRAMREK